MLAIRKKEINDVKAKEIELQRDRAEIQSYLLELQSIKFNYENDRSTAKTKGLSQIP
jgi:hypothetical protein